MTEDVQPFLDEPLPLSPAPPSEAELWRRQSLIASSALDFAITFLGCRMGPGNNQALTTDARNRFLDILRAVSIVESRHGTTGLSQPARDPIQCGNPNDSWWRELTGQSGNGSRFVRGPGLSNLWSREVAAEAERTGGFSAAATLSLLNNRNDGHRDARFTPSHSYLWGVLYLIQRINTNAGSPAFACGDLSRGRLIGGAVEYNGGGVSDYEQRIIDALDEFGGLALTFDSFTVSAGEVPVAEPTHNPGPVFGLTPLAALGFMVVASIVAISVGWFRYESFEYVNDFTTEAPRVITTLTVIALFMERALAAINAAWLGGETQRVRARLRLAEQTVWIGRGAIDALRAVLRDNATLEAKRQRLRVTIGFIIGLVVSGAGVRTLSPLIDVAATVTRLGQKIPDGQMALLNSIDILLTAGLLAGGSEALAKLADMIRAAVDATISRFQLNQLSLRRKSED